jgi:hypothetical protein
LDNEASTALKSFSTTNDVEYQPFQPHRHRRNAAERDICTFKEHFVAGVASVEPDFRLHLWDRLLPQSEITLNLLRTSRQHPQLSAAAHYHGMVNYNKTAFSENPAKHDYSLGPAMLHYRCQNVCIYATASKRIVDTLEFPPHNSLMPQLPSTDRLLVAANMTNALKDPHPRVPFAQIGDDTIIAPTQMATIFKKKVSKTKIARANSCPSQGRRKQETSRFDTTNFDSHHAA